MPGTPLARSSVARTAGRIYGGAARLLQQPIPAGACHLLIGAFAADLRLLQAEVAQVAEQGVFVRQGYGAVRQRILHGVHPRPRQQFPLLLRRQLRALQRRFQRGQLGIGVVVQRQGGLLRLLRQPVPGGAPQFPAAGPRRLLLLRDGELLPEIPQPHFLILRQDAVGQAFLNRLPPALGQRRADAVLVHKRPAGNGRQLAQQRRLAEIGPAGRLNHQRHHLLPPGLVGGVAFLMLAAQETGFAAAVLAVAHTYLLHRWKLF